MLSFKVGEQYSRKDVQHAAGCPDARGGIWDTGVVTPKVAGDFVVFATVGGEGTTGHDYPNRWEGSRLRWYHKRGSRFQWRSVQEMLHGGVPVHVFWRHSKADPFTYAGLVCRLSSSMQKSSPFRPRENAIDPGKV